MSEAPHPFDTAIALQAEGGAFHGSTSPAYANMIGPYGGITAAQALAAILQHPDRLGEPIAFTINFAAALADGAFEIRPRAARTNRSTQHWTLEIVQGDGVVATATAVTATRRETWSGHEAEMPEVPRPLDVPRTPRRGVEWLNRYDMRFLAGFIPRDWKGQETDDSLTRLWVRDDPPRPLDFASLTAAADVFFPRVWLRRATFTPIGTVSMSVYFHATSEQLQATGDGWLLVQAKGQGFGGGYFDHSGQLWNEAGELLATTHQVVYFKE
ncbi:thioesterase family protein [Ramlibacter sp. G-1-2-2]|uniref:Thioesterase family protein n=1 Tax=Ramlibacter agri TaxID=2728837 RepID=A0A848HH17_9BURK|nr:thioesterase family protein [Ramlibacter agri]NML47823.1 thioesterase family protein [Ramlibacter agri]